MMSSAAPETFSLDHLAQQQQPPAEQEQLCYVHCNFCDTILAVGVPCSSLFKTVTVRCGHCANMLSVNLRGLLLPAAANQLPIGQALLSPTSPHGLLDEVPFQAPPSLLTAEQASANVSSITSSNSSGANNSPATSMPPAKAAQSKPQLPKSAPSAATRPPEKRQRVPSAYNRFIKDEIQRIKASNPDITHREAFSAAAKNWAHFPHMHFGLMLDQGQKKTSIQSQLDGAGACMLFKDGLYAAAAAAAATAASSMGVTPF